MNTQKQICTFYIIRHGETEWNTQGRMQGHMDSPLTEEGIRQAYARSQSLKDVDFVDAFSSDLFRAQRTAEILAADHNLVVKTNQLLRERCFGSYEGETVQKYQEELRELLEARESLTEEEQFKYKLKEDIESDEEVVTRMLTFLRETAVAYPGKNVLVVAHGGIMRILLVHLGLVFAQKGYGVVDNLGYFKLESDGSDFTVVETVGINGIKE